MKSKYTGEDFEDIVNIYQDPSVFQIADTANALLPEIKKQWLEELVEKASPVYLREGMFIIVNEDMKKLLDSDGGASHQLVCIEKL